MSEGGRAGLRRLTMSALTVLGTSAAVASISSAWPQAVRLVRTRTPDGVSLATALMGVIGCATWLTYGALKVDAAQLITNAVCLGSALIVAFVVARETAARRAPLLLACAAWAVFAAGAAVAAGPAAIGLLATGLGLVSRLPQVRLALTATNLRGLSPAACAMAICASTAWLMYALVAGDTTVAISSSIGFVLNALVLVRRCPPPVVLRAMRAGRLGPIGQLAARPVVALVG